MNREDLTAKVFVPSPIPSVGCMYRTGDLGRWLPGGNLEYLGRMDHQIKLNGHRIELGEIEQVILRSDLVQDCVAMVLDKSSRPQLAVFCIFENSTEVDIEEPSTYTSKLLQLKGSLGSLAHYMVPKIVFPIGRFPRSSANKTDRQRLKKLAEALDTSKLSQYSLDVVGAEVDTFKSPISAEETFLQNEWSELFQIDKSEVGMSPSYPTFTVVLLVQSSYFSL
jgi:acyl-CoA synthetase (AMP-forming)/AMP-acid ligase II